MSRIAYIAAPNSKIVHVSVSTEKFLGADVHDHTVCGVKVQTVWYEVPRPTETGFESDLRRCKKCARKHLGGYSVDAPAFDYEEKLAGRDRYAQCDGTCTVDCGACKGAGRPTN